MYFFLTYQQRFGFSDQFSSFFRCWHAIKRAIFSASHLNWQQLPQKRCAPLPPPAITSRRDRKELIDSLAVIPPQSATTGAVITRLHITANTHLPSQPTGHAASMLPAGGRAQAGPRSEEGEDGYA